MFAIMIDLRTKVGTFLLNCVFLVLAVPLALVFHEYLSVLLNTVQLRGSKALFSLLFAMNDLTVLVLAVVLLFVSKTNYIWFLTPQKGGCCCDFRCAVIVMGLIGIIKSIIFLVPFTDLSVTGAAVMRSALSQIDKNIFIQFINTVIDGMADAVDIQVALLYVFQLVAAITYSVWMLALVIVVNLVWFVLGMINISNTGGGAGNIAGKIVFYVLFIGLEIYPTASLIKEIRGGTMSAHDFGDGKGKREKEEQPTDEEKKEKEQKANTSNSPDNFTITYNRNKTKLKFKTHAQLLSFSQGVRDDSLILSCGDGSDITLHRGHMLEKQGIKCCKLREVLLINNSFQTNAFGCGCGCGSLLLDIELAVLSFLDCSPRSLCFSYSTVTHTHTHTNPKKAAAAVISAVP